MASVNRVIIVGNVGQEPKTVQTRNGGTLTNFSVATSRTYKDGQNNTTEETEWHRIVAFGRLAEIVGQRLTKGSLVFVEGRLNTSKYTDKDGVEKTQTKIVAENVQFLDKAHNSEQQQQSVSVADEEEPW